MGPSKAHDLEYATLFKEQIFNVVFPLLLLIWFAFVIILG